MQLEDSGGAHGVALPMKLHFFGLCKLWLQQAAAQEAEAVREAQLPALGVCFKAHHEGWDGVTGGSTEREM